jgi:hypothetical protein
VQETLILRRKAKKRKTIYAGNVLEAQNSKNTPKLCLISTPCFSANCASQAHTEMLAKILAIQKRASDLIRELQATTPGKRSFPCSGKSRA